MAEVELIEFLAFISRIAAILIIIAIAIYVYLSLATMRLAKKTQTKYGWLAWIPLANFYLYSQMAGMHWWPIFLLAGMFIPYIGFLSLIAFTVFNFIWFWKIFEKVGKPGWWILFSLIPSAGWLITLILLGVAAWSAEENIIPVRYVETQPRPVPKQPQPARISSPRINRVKKLKSSLK